MKEQDKMESEVEINELNKKAGMTKNVKQKRRYDVIRLSLQGYSNNAITEILDISLRQVYNLINLYNKKGIEGLKLKYSPGRKTKLTAEQEKELYDVINVSSMEKIEKVAEICYNENNHKLKTERRFFYGTNSNFL